LGKLEIGQVSVRIVIKIWRPRLSRKKSVHWQIPGVSFALSSVLFPVLIMAETLQECIAKARKAVSLLSDSVEALIAEWQSDDQDAADAQSSPDGARLPTHAAYNAQQTIAACTGLLQELTFDPATRLFEINLEYAESRALHIAAHHRIADLVAEQDDGVHVNDLASKTGLEKRKLGKNT
jgi:hypothetical protein